jgi:hypothetical protein
MKHRHARILIALLLFSFCSLPLKSAYKNNNTVTIDWFTGEISARTFYSAQFDESGIPVDFASPESRTPTESKMQAYDMARESAVEMIAGALKSINIEKGLTVGDLTETDGRAAAEIGEILSGRIHTKETPVNFFGARCDAHIRLTDLIRAIPYEFPNLPIPEGQENPLGTEYTSLIVDSRGLDVSPMILPSVYDEDGLEIFGKRYINIRSAARDGLVVYTTGEKEARRHQKAGDHPYFVKAMKSLDKSPVIAHRDVRRILGHKKTVEKLKSCHVIFIIDGPTPSGKKR